MKVLLPKLFFISAACLLVSASCLCAQTSTGAAAPSTSSPVDSRIAQLKALRLKLVKQEQDDSEAAAKHKLDQEKQLTDLDRLIQSATVAAASPVAALVQSQERAAQVVMAEVPPPPPPQASSAQGTPPATRDADLSTKLISQGFEHCAVSDNGTDNSGAPPKNPILTAITKNLKFGGDGPSTQANVCSNGADVYLANTSESLASTGVSYNYNGVSKLANVNIAAAMGYTINLASIPWLSKDKSAGVITPFALIDHTSQTTESLSKGIVTRSTLFTEKYLEAGFVYKTGSVQFDAFNGAHIPIFSDIDWQATFEPFYLDDNLRHSRAWAFNLAFYPIYPAINEYDSLAPDIIPTWGYFSKGLIVEVNEDSSIFTEPGISLAASPTLAKQTSPFQAYNIPNDNYSRVGGRLGAFAEYDFNQDLTKLLSSKSLTGYFYYANYAALAGIRHDYGEWVGGLKLPMSSLLSLSAIYTNGRSENIAARIETFTIGLSFGGSESN